MPVLLLAGLVSWVAWVLMLIVGVLHGAEVISWTLGYDEASAIAWCVVPLVVFFQLFGVYLELSVHRHETRKVVARNDPFSDV